MPLELWDTDSCRLVRMFKPGVMTVVDVAFSPDGALLASVGSDGCIRVWDAFRDRDIIRIPLAGRARPYIGLSRDGRIALTGYGESTVDLWNAATGEALGKPLRLEHDVINSSFAADGKLLLLVDEGKNVTIWDVATGKLVHTFKHDGPAGLFQMALSADGKWFACNGPDRGLKVWDVEKGTPFRTFKIQGDRLSYSFSPDSTRLAVADRGGALKIWDVATGRALWTTELKNADIVILCFSHDGKWLAATGYPAGKLGGFTGEVRILEVEGGREASPPLRVTVPWLLKFSPDRKRLATAGPGGTVKVWDLASGLETLTLTGQTGSITAIEFSPDGHRLISASSDMTVRIWDATPLPE